MAVGDGVVWSESLPDNTTLASEIDDYDRDLRVGVRSRMALEHVWPSAHTGTGSAGRHTYITFQPQTAAPTMGGTTGGGLYVTTEASPRLIFTRSNGTDVTIVTTAGALTSILAGGTQGSLAVCSSASATTLTTVAGSADGRVLHTHSSTAAPNWLPIDLAGTSTVLSGVLGVANGGVAQTTAGLAHGGKVTEYAGNGSDNRTVAHDLGRTPIFIMIRSKGTETQGAALWMTGMTSGVDTSNGAPDATSIKSADATNVTLGTGQIVNGAATTYEVFAM